MVSVLLGVDVSGIFVVVNIVLAPHHINVYPIWRSLNIMLV